MGCVAALELACGTVAPNRARATATATAGAGATAHAERLHASGERRCPLCVS